MPGRVHVQAPGLHGEVVVGVRSDLDVRIVGRFGVEREFRDDGDLGADDRRRPGLCGPGRQPQPAEDERYRDPAEKERRGPRRVRLTLARLDPFSVMKLSFLAAIAIGIATVVAVILLWNLVEAIGLWSQIDQLGRDLNGGEPLPFMEFFTFSKMTSYGTIVAVVNVVIITALGTLGAFLYNLVAALLGGLKMTFTDE